MTKAEKQKTTSAIEDAIRNAPEDKDTILELKNLGKEGTRLEITKRAAAKHQDPRQETGPRAHRFYDVPGFAEYLGKYGSQDTVLYVDVANESAWAIINEKATEQVETVRLEPITHPRWEPWKAALGCNFDLSDFVDFVRQNRRSIMTPGGKELVLALSQVKASSHAEIHVGQGAESMNGVLVKTKVQGSDTTELVELPDEIVVKTPIYVARPALEIQIDLIVELLGERVVVRLSSGDLMEAKIQAFEDITSELIGHEKLSKMIRTHGHPSHGKWEYTNAIRD